MSFTFRPAEDYTDRHGCFVALVGGTSSGKTFSALRLARGIAGPSGRIAVLDTEGGRTLHLKRDFKFDTMVMDPPYRPQRFSDAALSAEQAGYDCLLIDSFSAEWAGMGGVLDYQNEELTEAVERQRASASLKGWKFDENKAMNANKMASWIKPKMAHKAMVYSFLQRRIPIIFSIRADSTVKPGENGEKPQTLIKPVCNANFIFEVTVSFRLAQEAKGIIDLSDPTSYKMEGSHKDIFKNGEQLSERHGAALAEWAKGSVQSLPPPSGVPSVDIIQHEILARDIAKNGVEAYREHWSSLTKDIRSYLLPIHEELKAIAQGATNGTQQ